MKANKKFIAIGIIAAAIIAAVVSVVIVKNQPKGMVVAVSELPDSLNPVLEQNTMGLNAVELIFDGLCNFEVEPSSGKLITEFALAENIEQNQKDRKTYTVTLIDVPWHDSTDENPHVLTAEDVEFSFNAYVLPENESPNRDYLNSFIERVTAIDEKTVEIEFRNPIPEFRAYPILTFKIIPAEINGQKLNVNLRNGDNERKVATAPVGTGPFKFESWEIGKWITFSGNGMYFKGKPQADSLVIKRTIDPIVRMNELQKGKVNVILETNPMDRSSVEKIDNVDINSFMPYAFYEVAINTSHFPNAEGRQAMARAVNKKDLIPGITDEDEGVVLNNGPFPSNTFAVAAADYAKGAMPNILSFDVKSAKKLAEAGGIAGQNAILIYPDSMGEFGKQLADAVAKQLKEIGLNVEPRRTGDQVFNRMVYKEKSYDLALMYCEGFDNLYSSLGSYYRTKGSENVTGIADKELDGLFDKIEAESTTQKWIEYVLAIDKRVADLSPAIYLCTLQKDVYSRGLKNVLIATDNPFLSVEEWRFKN